jgi:hypothetical protein
MCVSPASVPCEPWRIPPSPATEPDQRQQQRPRDASRVPIVCSCALRRQAWEDTSTRRTAILPRVACE